MRATQREEDRQRASERAGERERASERDSKREGEGGREGRQGDVFVRESSRVYACACLLTEGKHTESLEKGR